MNVPYNPDTSTIPGGRTETRRKDKSPFTLSGVEGCVARTMGLVFMPFDRLRVNGNRELINSSYAADNSLSCLNEAFSPAI